MSHQGTELPAALQAQPKQDLSKSSRRLFYDYIQGKMGRHRAHERECRIPRSWLYEGHFLSRTDVVHEPVVSVPGFKVHSSQARSDTFEQLASQV